MHQACYVQYIHRLHIQTVTRLDMYVRAGRVDEVALGCGQEWSVSRAHVPDIYTLFIRARKAAYTRLSSSTAAYKNVYTFSKCKAHKRIIDYI